jgi:hypothetical protein
LANVELAVDPECLARSAEGTRLRNQSCEPELARPQVFAFFAFFFFFAMFDPSFARVRDGRV